MGKRQESRKPFRRDSEREEHKSIWHAAVSAKTKPEVVECVGFNSMFVNVSS